MTALENVAVRSETRQGFKDAFAVGEAELEPPSPQGSQFTHLPRNVRRRAAARGDRFARSGAFAASSLVADEPPAISTRKTDARSST